MEGLIEGTTPITPHEQIGNDGGWLTYVETIRAMEEKAV